MFKADGLTCRFVKPPQGFTGPAAHETDGVTSVDRLGMEVRVTTLARTVADLFDRHDLAGGAEELFNSLDLVARVDAVALVRHARARGNAAAAGAMGFWLERERERLGVPREALEDLRALAPSRPRYALGAKPGSARTARGWKQSLVRQRMAGPRTDEIEPDRADERLANFGGFPDLGGFPQTSHVPSRGRWQAPCGSPGALGRVVGIRGSDISCA